MGLRTFKRAVTALLLVALVLPVPGAPRSAQAATPGPMRACSEALTRSSRFTAFIAANPELAKATDEERVIIYVERGAAAWRDVYRAAVGSAITAGLFSITDEDGETVGLDALPQEDPDLMRFKLPANHPSQLVSPIVDARIALLSGNPRKAMQIAGAQREALQRQYGANDVRLLPTYRIEADAYRALAEPQVAAEADTRYVQIAAARKDLATPLAGLSMTRQYQLASFWEDEIAARGKPDVIETSMVAQRDSFREGAEDLARKQHFALFNILGVVTGAIPGGTPLSLAAPDPEQMSLDMRGLLTLIETAVEASVVVSADARVSTEPFGAASGAKARLQTAARCANASGMALAAWDPEVSVRTLRTALRQIDSRTILDTIAMVERGEELPLSEVDDALSEEFGLFTALAMAQLYSTGHTRELDNALTAALGRPVLRRLLKSMGEDNLPEDAVKYGPQLALGVERLRALLVDLIRAPSRKTVKNAQAVDAWISSSRPMIVELISKGLADGDASPADAQRWAEDTYRLIDAYGDGLVAQAAHAVGDDATARQAMLRSVDQTIALGRRLAPKGVRRQEAQRQKIATLAFDDPAYRVAAEEFGRASLDVGATAAIDIALKLGDEAGDTKAAQRTRTLYSLGAVFGSDFFFGVPADIPERRRRAVLTAAAIDIGDQELRSEIGDDWLQQFETMELDIEDIDSTFEDRMKAAGRLTGAAPLIARLTHQVFVYDQGLREFGYVRQSALVGRLVGAGVRVGSKAPPKLRASALQLVPASSFLDIGNLLSASALDDSVRLTQNLGVEAKRFAVVDPRTSLAAQTRLWRDDRDSWINNATLVANRILKAEKPRTEDLDFMLNAVEAANRGAAGAQLEESLRALNLPPRAREAFEAYRRASAYLEQQRYDTQTNARKRMKLGQSLDSLSTPAAVSTAGLEAARAKADAAYEHYVAVRRELRLPAENPTLTVAQVQASLTGDEVLLTGVPLQGRLLLVTVTKAGGMRVVGSPYGLEYTKGWIAKYLLELGPGRGNVAFESDPSRALGQILLAPVGSQIARPPRVVWVPPRDLDNFPLAAVQASTGMLGLEKELMTVPSIRGLIELRAARSERGYGALAVGDIGFSGPKATPVTGEFNLNRTLGATRYGEGVLGSVASGAPGSLVLRGSSASKTALQALSPRRFKLAVFYTHAVSGRLLERCGTGAPQALILYQGGRDTCASAALSPADVAQLPVTADIVMLAACSTQEQPEAELHAMDGLTRGFLQSGARAVIGAHVKVPDEAGAQFARAISPQLLGGLGPSTAVRSVMRTMAGNPATTHPRNWANFELVGDGALATGGAPANRAR